MTGFEPATPCSQSICATKLRYIPLFSLLNSEKHIKNVLKNFLINESLIKYLNSFFYIVIKKQKKINIWLFCFSNMLDIFISRKKTSSISTEMSLFLFNIHSCCSQIQYISNILLYWQKKYSNCDSKQSSCRGKTKIFQWLFAFFGLAHALAHAQRAWARAWARARQGHDTSVIKKNETITEKTKQKLF